MTSTPRASPDTVHDAMHNRIAIVTGAARGIGFSTASLLAQHGARVVLVDLHEDQLKHACAMIGSHCTYHVCDVSDWDQQVELFSRVASTIGPIHLLVCNAAINPEISLLQSSTAENHAQMSSQVRYNYLAEEVDPTKENSPLQRPSTRVFDVNVNSVLFGLKLGIHHMRQTGGRIVVIGSAGSYVPIPSQPLYAASKHAVLGLVRSTALMDDVVASGISISWVAPWLTLTAMVEGIEATHQSHTLKSQPDDVAWGVVTAAVAENANGKGYWTQGRTINEVEAAYGELAGRLMVPENRF